jgi:uncharacterized protein
MPAEKVFFNNSKGMKLAAWLSTPDGEGPFPAVIRAHGYKSSKDGKKGAAFVKEFPNYIFFQFDFHGHGESEGKFEEVDAAQCVDDLRHAIDYIYNLSNVDKKQIAVIGSSLGGLATTLAVAWHNKVAVAVPLCPVSDFEPLRVRDIKHQELVKINVYKEAEKIHCPTLVIHGDRDDAVPIEQSIELEKHLKNGTLHIIKNADHQFTDERHFDELVIETVKFIQNVFDGTDK